MDIIKEDIQRIGLTEEHSRDREAIAGYMLLHVITVITSVITSWLVILNKILSADTWQKRDICFTVSCLSECQPITFPRNIISTVILNP